MIYLLDTDIIIYWLNGSLEIEQRIISTTLENICFSIISKAELYFGAYNSNQVENNINVIEKLSNKISILPFDEKASKIFGQLKAYLKKEGKVILDADIMIASIALANNLTLVTNNIRHFKRIETLRIEHWTK